MGAEAYTGARMVRCRDEELTHGARCPHDGRRGKLYDTKQPANFIRLTGQPLVGATRSTFSAQEQDRDRKALLRRFIVFGQRERFTHIPDDARRTS
jgi:hypothetical protein